MFLKNEGRIEALFFLYLLALLVQALIERQVRLEMEKEGSFRSVQVAGSFCTTRLETDGDLYNSP